MAVADTLVLAYGLHPADITRTPQGTATDNYAIVDQTGQRHFAKVYRTREDFDLERASVELSEYAADGGVATARATRTRGHELLAELNAAGELDWSRVCVDGSHIRAKKGEPTPVRRRSTGARRAASTT
ncbi:hypothetical protein ABZZ74_52590 [Streptomyces sp. NPDC006476]|uniref:hypothetical protein n=1 Tax=Streptomyces sp. NPDC006476 TaxID=3157175 RepID=UPI0033A38410